MSFKDRFQIILKTTGILMYLLISIGYGFVFGGIFSVANYVEGEASFVEVIKQILMTSTMYGSMFLLIISIVIVASIIKTYLSLGMERRDVVKIWRDVFIGSTGIMSILSYLVILGFISEKDMLMRRTLDLNMNGLSIWEHLILLSVIIIGVTFVNLLISMIANIGNHFGMINCFATIGIVSSLIIFTVPYLIDLVKWGEQRSLFMVGLVVISIGLYIGNKKLIKTTEIVR